MSATRHDVVVLGGGPAGCAAATLLARRAHDVVLVRPSRPPAAPLAQSIPPSARRILEELGMLEAVAAAGFHRNRGNTVWWAGEPARVEIFPDDGIGFHTDRATLESVLVGVAERSGVRVEAGTSAREARQGDGGWTVRCEGPTGDLELDAPWVIDATGRHGLLARAEGREPDRSTTTLALVRRWRSPEGWPAETRWHTLVESHPDGWVWSVPIDDEVRCVTAMIDQRHADLAGSGGAASLDALLDEELAKTSHLGGSLEGAIPEGEAWACPASLYTASRFGRPGLLLAGDAGSFIDPLSSFGVKKALSSGWLAGVVAHTALVDPALTDAALSFFDAREHEVYRSYRRASTAFFETAAAVHGTRYWQERAEAARAAGGSGEAPDDPDRIGAVVPEDRVRLAFDEIRSKDQLVAVRGTTLEWVERPTIEGQRIVLREHLASDRCPAGMRYVRGVDLGAVIEVAPRHADVPDGWAAYNGVGPPVTLPDYLTALATAFAAGFLEHGDV